jgi:CBS domain-containing protein/gamma-glutamyl:cysteine ligase YbdK (ATP-grasp superfamily)
MGETNVLQAAGREEASQLRSFTRRLLKDLRALERMIADEKFEEGKRRIGAEQEVFLVDRSWRPAPLAMRMLERLDDPHYTTEVALYNLEMNLDPVLFGGDCLSRMHAQLDELVGRAREAARSIGGEIVLTGILPTVRKSDLGLDNMTPLPRYATLNRAMTRLRGGPYEIHIKGVDEVMLRHDSVMLESCNASFQAHFQVGAREFPHLYNIAQVIAAPVLACAVNSPLLFGRRLWRETRIALFQQSVDTRSSGHALRSSMPRVDFGRQWVRESVLELFQEGISRFRILIANEPEEDPMGLLERGAFPELRALRLHNGTIYRWNRACYGLIEGRPHLRVENRVMPSGPTTLDEIANSALWFGLMSALASEHEDVTREISFDDVKANFLAAARLGLGGEITWFGGQPTSAQRLLLDRLIPQARAGLRAGKIAEGDIERYMGVIEERVRTGRTGAQWLVRSLAEMDARGPEGERLNALTAGTVARQSSGEPVARWDLARLEEGGGWRNNYVKVEQFMETDFVTVHPGDALDLVAQLMVWERIRHVPVEDDDGHLVGLITYRALLRAWTAKDGDDAVPVSEVMKRDPWTVGPELSTLQAIALMREKQVGCLPVVKDGRLVGMVMARSFMGIAAQLLEEKLRT